MLHVVSNNQSIHGGYFEGGSATNGVIGKGSTGIYGEGTSTGLYGYTSQGIGTGIKARNASASGAGAALDVEGPIKSDLFSNSAGTVNRQAGGYTKDITANASAVGKITVTIAGAGGVQDTATIKVNNTNITADSFIVAMVNNEPTAVYAQGSGYFSLRFTSNGTYTIKYLVIKI
jgi:hypothetical protein